MKSTGIHLKIIHNANVRAGLVERATSILGVLGSTSAKVFMALLKPVRTFKLCKPVVLIKFGGFSQAISLKSPFACVQQPCGSAMDHLGSLDHCFTCEPFKYYVV